MIVAPSTADRDTHDRRTDRLHDFVHAISAGLSNCGRFAADRCRGNVRAGDKEASRFSHAQRISGDLFANEFIIRLVLVEGSGDVVAIDPGILAIKIRLGPIGFRPANNVEPMLCPTFAEMW